MEGETLNAPPIPKLLDYPASLGVALVVVFTAILLFLAGRFDPTGGVLTISLMVVLAFLGLVVFCAFFTLPTDEITSSVIGGLTASFGAIIAFWLGRKDGDK
jgi:FtsH-binding integral membrane protein